MRTVHIADATERSRSFLGYAFDRLEFTDVLALLQQEPDSPGFRYVVTPNVDHVVRRADQPDFARACDAAWLTLCDSRPLRAAARLFSVRLPLVTGSDLTATLFHHVIPDGSRIAVIAPTHEVLDALAGQFPAFEIVGHVPPPGIDGKPEAMAQCVRFIAQAGARYVFIAIGCPRSERIAYLASLDPQARGTGFCVGAALEFVTGRKPRAPLWMRRICLEWLHRLATDPVRLWRRYLFAVPRLAALLAAEARHRRVAPAR